MKNKKGFVLTETLVVVVFLVSIFTFVYVSIIPLIGKYEDSVNRKSDIDIVYKLYHIRKMINNDSNKPLVIVSRNDNLIMSGTQLCNTLSNSGYCNILFEYLELNKDTCMFAYIDNISTRMTYFEGLSFDGENGQTYIENEIYDYLSDYINSADSAILLWDRDTHHIAHLSVT